MEEIGEMILRLVDSYQQQYPDKNCQYYLNWLDRLNQISVR